MDDRESQIDELIEKFNFERVHIVMTALDWEWRSLPNEPGGVPTVSRLKAMARHLLHEAINHKVVESGGFKARYYPQVTNEPEYFSLAFIVCQSETLDD